MRTPSSAVRAGIAAVELALVLPFIMFFLMGMWEVGRIIEVHQILSNAAREGGRQASAGQLDATQIDTLVKQYIKNQGLTNTNVKTTLTNKGYTGNPAPADNNPQNATDLDQLQLTVKIPLADVKWVNFTVFTGGVTDLYVTVSWPSMKDRAYAIPTPPSGS